MKILLIILSFILGYIVGRDYWIDEMSTMMSELICESKTIEELKRKLRERGR